MARLNFKDILNRVANRVGIKQPDNYQRLSLLQHIYDELIWIHARTEDKREVTLRQAIFDGLPIATAPTVQAGDYAGFGAIAIGAGFYTYKFAYKNALQGESEAVTTETVEVTGTDGIWISDIPELPFGVTSIEVYRTKVNGNIFYHHSSKTNNTTVLYDNVPDTSLVTPYVTRDRYADKSYISFPDDYFLLKTARFFNQDNERVFSKEAPTEQTFGDYEPASIQENSDSFRAVVDGTVPFTTGITEENILYDGVVLYTLQDTTPPTFNYKPRINGYLEWMYLAIPDINFSDMSANPDVFYAFLDLLVTGATIRATKVMLRSPDNKYSDVQLQAIVVTLRMDVDDYKNKLKNYAGYVKQTTEVHAVRAHNFLNDISMDIGA